MSQNRFFKKNFTTKSSNFISNINEDFYEAFFEVYYIFVRQKLAILGFSPKIFFILTLITSDTFWGQTMHFSDLTEVSNFSWRCQLSYEILFVGLKWKSAKVRLHFLEFKFWFFFRKQLRITILGCSIS